MIKKILLSLICIIALSACAPAVSRGGYAKYADEDTDYPELQHVAQKNIGPTGDYSTHDFNPTTYLSSWNFNNLPPEERSKFYKETSLPDKTLLREYRFDVQEIQIEVAPNVFYPAWAYNGQVPGPTIRATDGDTIRIYFKNLSSKPHTIHFHGFHSANMDGSGADSDDPLILPGENFTYEFKAEPFGFHVYHCHSYPVSQHISKGLYGAYIVDPKNDTRPKADKELVMVMNAFDTNFDGENEVYSVNTRAFAYAKSPIDVKKGELVRVYLTNMVEFDLLNSFHLHANFFDVYPTGTRLQPNDFTDTIVLGQAERSVLDVRFREAGMFMFHAHVGEFSELGWMGMFAVH
ncbi:multicopper oxidase domain-containing protein [Candidatus Peregrinibacteria bacterium]|nr:multicopper oxidase domain-containing protein [Candidatus Peregrinibacteria bacterium]